MNVVQDPILGKGPLVKKTPSSLGVETWKTKNKLKEQLHGLADEDLIKKYLKTENEIYYNALYKKYSIKVFSKCISLLKSKEKAEDATQDIFVKIFLNLSKFWGKSKFSTWIYSITYNYCIDIIRKEKKQRNIFDDQLENIPDQAEEELPDHFLLELEMKKLKFLLEKVSVWDKIVLLMKYQDHMKIKEIALALDKSESAIKMKLKRAKQRIQKKYEQYYGKRTVTI